ncbi:MAG: methylated-DNA--[protein]-cysteine S-methyltransferase [Bacteroidales bacterium]|jgi:methylated-DNA-[protein]-cysteine S-methyltransferase|nr:methylated-DNA--[protein]-cysteine S-methyltransferase [Bacteroidales bacterium]
MFEAYYKSPIGNLRIISNERDIIKIEFSVEYFKMKVLPIQLENCITQLDEYFKGERKKFTIGINPAGTEFQSKVWNLLLKIPFGKKISYLDQSKQFGDEKAIRAIASANGKNPIPIIIPCHRVIGNNGKLTGYAGGLLKKQWLLEHEGAIQQKSLFH